MHTIKQNKDKSSHHIQSQRINWLYTANESIVSFVVFDIRISHASLQAESI